MSRTKVDYKEIEIDQVPVREFRKSPLGVLENSQGPVAVTAHKNEKMIALKPDDFYTMVNALASKGIKVKSLFSSTAA